MGDEDTEQDDTLPGPGHNSAPQSGFAKGQLISLVERIERLNEEKAALGTDITEVYAEAKSHGFDAKILRKVIALRKLDSDDRQEIEAVMDLYMSALGMR